MKRRASDLYDGLGDEGREVGHQLAVDVSNAEALGHHRDEAHRPVADPQVGVAEERSWNTEHDIRNTHQEHSSGTLIRNTEGQQEH